MNGVDITTLQQRYMYVDDIHSLIIVKSHHVEVASVPMTDYCSSPSQTFYAHAAEEKMEGALSALLQLRINDIVRAHLESRADKTRPCSNGLTNHIERRDMTGLVWLLIGAVCCPLVLADIVLIENDLENSDFALTWLRTYGYLHYATELTIESVDAAIQRMQNFLNLPETGKVDEETLRVMKLPRCGVPDFEPNEDYVKSKRFRTLGAWPGSKKHLTYSISTYSSDMNNGDIDSDIASALKMWEDNSGLSFAQTSGYGDIRFFFYADSDHGDGNTFAETTIAHAFFPNSLRRGLVHYNDAWVFAKSGSASGGIIDLQYITLHEIGHTIGLRHSGMAGAIMLPQYNMAHVNNAALTPDDIAGARKLYGS
ncbi:matrilysin-like [Asterias amurensis]|uniref:matrilysin-like n=1 Tax=Asterias amurensis TaxID=7602 RepID=UPI003AB46A51